MKRWVQYQKFWEGEKPHWHNFYYTTLFYLFFLIYFLLLFNYSCMPFLPFPPPTPAETISLPHPHHPPRFCPCVLYNSSCILHYIIIYTILLLVVNPLLCLIYKLSFVCRAKTWFTQGLLPSVGSGIHAGVGMHPLWLSGDNCILFLKFICI